MNNRLYCVLVVRLLGLSRASVPAGCGAGDMHAGGVHSQLLAATHHSGCTRSSMCLFPPMMKN